MQNPLGKLPYQAKDKKRRCNGTQEIPPNGTMEFDIRKKDDVDKEY
jgi:hypothetical protein